jgi:hypothetical protein
MSDRKNIARSFMRSAGRLCMAAVADIDRYADKLVKRQQGQPFIGVNEWEAPRRGLTSEEQATLPLPGSKIPRCRVCGYNFCVPVNCWMEDGRNFFYEENDHSWRVHFYCVNCHWVEEEGVVIANDEIQAIDVEMREELAAIERAADKAEQDEVVLRFALELQHGLILPEDFNAPA